MKIKNSTICHNEGLVPSYPVSQFIEIEQDDAFSYSNVYSEINNINNIIFYGDIVNCLEEFVWLNPRLVSDGIHITTVINLDIYNEALSIVDPLNGYITNQFGLLASKFDNRNWMNILKNNYSGISSLIVNHENPTVIDNVCNTIFKHKVELFRIFYNTNLIKDKILQLYPLRSVPILGENNAHPSQTSDLG